MTEEEQVLTQGTYRSYSYKVFTDKVTFKLDENNPRELEELKDFEFVSDRKNIENTKKLIEKIIDTFSWQYCGQKYGYKISIRFSTKDSPGNWVAQVLFCSREGERGTIIDSLPDPTTAITAAGNLIENINRWM